MEYNSLKARNEFLKLQMINITKAETTEIKSSQAEIATSAAISSPFFSHDQPSLVPFFCPFIQPSNVVKYAYHSNVMSSSSHLSQGMSLGITETGNPVFVLPVPWLLPFPSYSAALLSYSDTSKSQNGAPSTQQCSISSSSDAVFVGDNHELSSNPSMEVEACSCTRSMLVGSATDPGLTFSLDICDHYKRDHPKVAPLVPEKSSCLRHVESTRHKGDSDEDSIQNVNASTATDLSLQTLPSKHPETTKKSENLFAATKARKRRKELMKLKNMEHDHVRSHNMDY